MSKVDGNSDKVLIIGATGCIGEFIAESSLENGKTTYLLVRPGSSASPSKDAILKKFTSKGAIIIEGEATDKDLVEKKIREYQIDVVISAIAGHALLEQLSLVEAIKAAGNVKRFLPSEFGHDVDKSNPEEPAQSFYNIKRKVRRATEDAGIPYTYICCNSIAGWPYFDNIHPCNVCPPLEQFQIYGDGNQEAYFVAGVDIGKFTIKACFDPRTINKHVHFRPACNKFSLNKMAALWESKIGRTLPRVTITEQDLLTMAKEYSFPSCVVAALTHDVFIQGCQVNFFIDGVKDLEIGSLYPDSSYKTLDECFNEYAEDLRIKESH
uniref:Leucoanthocyanidin reductase n=1 Tax=Narcissus tazetta subsp. chinensis TaxID=391288 RepID=A0A097P5Y9_NARTA|nr:leucoanthocyanidin reductase [Narcissus tazetta subsp. chinensis]